MPPLETSGDTLNLPSIAASSPPPQDYGWRLPHSYSQTASSATVLSLLTVVQLSVAQNTKPGIECTSSRRFGRAEESNPEPLAPVHQLIVVVCIFRYDLSLHNLVKSFNKPEVAKALLHAFVDKHGQSAIPNAPPAFSPWKLTTGDKDLALVVSDELKRIGVRPFDLCNTGLSEPQTNSIMQEAFTRHFATVKMAAGYTGIAAAAIKTPRLKFSGTSSSNLIP